MIDKKNDTCDWCHPNPRAEGRDRRGRPQHERGPADNADDHNDGRAATASFFKNIGNGTDPNGSYNNATKVCSNVDCHGGTPTYSWYYTSDSAAPVFNGGGSAIAADNTGSPAGPSG